MPNISYVLKLEVAIIQLLDAIRPLKVDDKPIIDLSYTLYLAVRDAERCLPSSGIL
jgi:hypothetical protein